MATLLTSFFAVIVTIISAIPTSTVSHAQVVGGDYVPHCITVKHLKLEDYWEDSRVVLVNTCNRPLWVAYCNVGAIPKMAGCGTGSKYYRQKRYFKANEKYDNKFNLSKQHSQQWAECPANEDRKGGFEELNSDGSYRCEGMTKHYAQTTEQHFSCADVPGVTSGAGPVIVKESIPGIVIIEGPGATVNANLSKYFTRSGEAKTLTGADFSDMQNSLVKAMAQACTGSAFKNDDTSTFLQAGESAKDPAEKLLNWFGNCEKNDLDCKNRTFSGKTRVTAGGVRG